MVDLGVEIRADDPPKMDLSPKFYLILRIWCLRVQEVKSWPRSSNLSQRTSAVSYEPTESKFERRFEQRPPLSAPLTTS